MVTNVFGNDGAAAVFQIMDVVKRLYSHIDPERVTGEIVVYRRINPECCGRNQAAQRIIDLATLGGSVVSSLVLEVSACGDVYQRSRKECRIETLAPGAVVYRYVGGREEFLAGSQRRDVARLDAAAHSQFAVPTLSSLREALTHYATGNVRESSCYIFCDVWRDEKRLFFRTGPEKTIRRSLVQFLRNRMGIDYHVFPEQNVNETRPIDIRVQPRCRGNQLMLIEIKWLGDSAADDGHITARHRDPRAQDGAEQLAEYLDLQRQSAPNSVIQGYYVIVDGRRDGLRPGMTTIDRRRGFFYENVEIAFDPEVHTTRDDFDPPYRMFARPVCT